MIIVAFFSLLLNYSLLRLALKAQGQLSKIILHLSFILLSYGLFTHLIPGFPNQKIFDAKAILKAIAISFLGCVILLAGLGFSLNSIALAPKLPRLFWVWCLNNFLLVCIAEEAFFRRYIQGHLLPQMIDGEWLPLILASLLFGLAHYKGGLAYIFLYFPLFPCRSFLWSQFSENRKNRSCHSDSLSSQCYSFFPLQLSSISRLTHRFQN